jgi:hypothetical protein
MGKVEHARQHTNASTLGPERGSNLGLKVKKLPEAAVKCRPVVRCFQRLLHFIHHLSTMATLRRTQRMKFLIFTHENAMHPHRIQQTVEDPLGNHLFVS